MVDDMEQQPMSIEPHRTRSLEEVGISIRQAIESDLPGVQRFLTRPDIDSLFTPALSDPARGITIADRVQSKFNVGVWIVSAHEGEIVGCMAVVPSKLPIEVPQRDETSGIKVSEGISFAGWGASKLFELSTVVTDRDLRDKLGVKGVGAELLNEAKRWMRTNGGGDWGLVTDSWVGGDMGGFVDNMNAKAYRAWLAEKSLPAPEKPFLDTIVRIYTDPGKRGKNGPPTVVYGIPIEDRDWNFFIDKASDIGKIRAVYEDLEQHL